MITILGIQFPVSKKTLYPKNSEVIQSYIDAIKKGKGTAEKNLKF